MFIGNSNYWWIVVVKFGAVFVTITLNPKRLKLCESANFTLINVVPTSVNAFGFNV